MTVFHRLHRLLHMSAWGMSCPREVQQLLDRRQCSAAATLSSGGQCEAPVSASLPRACSSLVSAADHPALAINTQAIC